MTPPIIILSYYGPEEQTSGVRSGKLALAAASAGIPVHLVHGAAATDRYAWQDGVHAWTFRRMDPASARDRRRQPLTQFRLPAPGRSLQAPILRSAKRAIRTVLQPDEMRLSASRFVDRARAALRETSGHPGPRTVIVSGPPWSSQLVGLRLAQADRARVVMDYQDLWSSNPVAVWPPFALRRSRHWEASCIGHAAGAIFVNQAVGNHLQTTWPRLRETPSAVVPIGFASPLDHPLHLPSSPELTLGYFGTIYGGRSLDALLDACLAARMHGVSVVLRWHGELLGDHPMRQSIPRFIREGVLEVYPPLPLDRAREAMRKCDLLVTVPSPGYSEELTGKLYDYLDAERPVLALAEADSLIGSFLRDASVGHAIPPGQSAALSAYLVQAGRRGFSLIPQQDHLQPHRLEAIARTLTDLIERVAEPCR